MSNSNSPEYGPVYNPLNNKGLPLLGAWEQARPKPNVSHSSSGKQYKNYIPFEGPVILNSVWIDDNGAIQYNGGHKEGFSALLFDEDFEIAEQLIFEERVFPEFYLDLEKQKIFNPAWLGETDFGRTLYACHHFINQLVFATDDYDIAPKEMFFDQVWHDPVKSMIGYIPVVRQQSNINNSNYMARVKPIQFRGDIAGDLSKKDVNNANWQITDIDLDITFEVFDQSSGKIIKPISMFLDKHREAFPQLIPNFERFRQLYKLLYSLEQLKKAGYTR